MREFLSEMAQGRPCLRDSVRMRFFLFSVAAASDCLAEPLRFGVDFLRSRHAYVCCNNEHYAEPAGSLQHTSLFKEVQEDTVFYDAKCGIPLFTLGSRSQEAFRKESVSHGWPSFRDAEVIELGKNVIERENGEIVSSCGTHLGHNLPDSKGNRYCINLLCVAGSPTKAEL